LGRSRFNFDEGPTFSLRVAAPGRSTMNINLLIDAIVRQTTVLIAQLATAAGARASLAHTANQVFLNLVRELKDQGLTNTLIADMFGLSLRTYHNKMRRLSESSTERGRSLWEAVLAYIEERQSVRRTQVLEHFSRDDDASVRSVLGDLVESGLVLQGGRGERVLYRAAAPEDQALEDDDTEAQAIASLVWITIARHKRMARSALLQLLPLNEAMLEAAISELSADGRVSVHAEADEIEYRSSECVIAMGEPVGWEASVFDHYQAMVTAICTKLRTGQKRALAGEWIGGSTYGFDIGTEHPLHDEVVGFLQTTRARAAALRARVDEYNAKTQPAEDSSFRVIAYVGQTVVGLDSGVES
ncbi:MAG TPA: hypothetical protein VGP93_18340, partial [Polyangiaceae bacterium]|nr:hypothetical protein [Polyangiaceae bacterium]